MDFDPNAGGAIAVHGDDGSSKPKGHPCYVVAALTLACMAIAFAGGYVLAALVF